MQYLLDTETLIRHFTDDVKYQITNLTNHLITQS